MIKYNVNNRIKVKLTKYGKSILEREVADTMSMLKTLDFSDEYFPYPENDDGYTEFQLWNFMRIFGNYFAVGSPLIIENNEIIFMDTDNAPTVEPRIEYGTDGQPYRMFMSGGQVVPDVLQGWRYEERPQGEWIDEGQYAEGHSEHAYICKKCGYQIIENPNMLFENRYCKYCGVSMRKGDKE